MRRFQDEFLANEKIAVDQRVERVGAGTFRRVFDGHDAAEGVCAPHGVENAVDARGFSVAGCESEEVARRHVAERPFRPEKGDGDRRLQRETPAHDLAVNRANGFARKVSCPLGDESIEHGAFALGIVIRRQTRLAFSFGDALHRTGASLEQAEDLLVDEIDLRAKLFELAQAQHLVFASASIGRQSSIAVANFSIQVARSGSFKIS